YVSSGAVGIERLRAASFALAIPEHQLPGPLQPIERRFVASHKLPLGMSNGQKHPFDPCEKRRSIDRDAKAHPTIDKSPGGVPRERGPRPLGVVRVEQARLN